MILNAAGIVANGCWLDIPNHFPNAVLHEHVVMPNHVHGIIEIQRANVMRDLGDDDAGAVRDVGVENFQPLRKPINLPPQQHDFQK